MFAQPMKQSKTVARRRNNVAHKRFAGARHRGTSFYGGNSLDALTLLLQVRNLLIDPLSTVLSASELLVLQKSTLTHTQHDHTIQRIEHETLRILRILDELTTFARTLRSEFEPEISDFSPAQVLDQIKFQCQPYAAKKGLLFDVITQDGMPATLQNDAFSIQMILMVLVWNAISFTNTGHVQIVSEWANGWQISVKDTGPGLPDNIVANLYEPLRRGITPGTEVPTSGVGLDLATAWGLAHALGGSLTLVNTSAQGTSFNLSIPMLKAL